LDALSHHQLHDSSQCCRSPVWQMTSLSKHHTMLAKLPVIVPINCSSRILMAPTLFACPTNIMSCLLYGDNDRNWAQTAYTRMSECFLLPANVGLLLVLGMTLHPSLTSAVSIRYGKVEQHRESAMSDLNLLQNHHEGFVARLWPDSKDTAPQLMPYNKYLLLGLIGNTSVACDFRINTVRSGSPLIQSLLQANVTQPRGTSPLGMTSAGATKGLVRPLATKPLDLGDYEVPDDSRRQHVPPPVATRRPLQADSHYEPAVPFYDQASGCTTVQSGGLTQAMLQLAVPGEGAARVTSTMSSIHSARSKGSSMYECPTGADPTYEVPVGDSDS
jgi:hypothetical protein